jgi:HEAT repeat protein
MMDPNRMKVMLKSKNPDQQTTALYTILHEPDIKQYIEELIPCLSSRDKSVRLATCMVFEKIRNKKILPLLEKALDDKYDKVSMIAAIAGVNPTDCTKYDRVLDRIDSL